MNPSNRNQLTYSLARRVLATVALGAAALSAKADYPADVLAAGPLLYYRLNEPVTPFFDVSTNSGSLGAAGNGSYSDVTHLAPGAIVSQPGDAAVGFTTSGDMSVPFQSVFNNAAPFSFEFWAKPADSGTTRCVASQIKVGNSGWLFYNSLTAGAWTFRVINSASANLNVTGGTVTPGAWHYIVGVWDGSTNWLYVNGIQVASGPAPTFLPVSDTTVPLTVGGRSDGAFLFNGSVDEPAFYTNVLSPGQILAHYQAGTNAAPATPYNQVVLGDGAVGYWRLDEPPVQLAATNIGFYGASANGAYYGGVVSTNGPSAPTYAGFATNNTGVEFDGSTGYIRIPPGTNNLSGGSLTNVTQATFLCWIQMNGLQGTYKGLLAMRPLSTGLYLDGDSTLNYSWNDDGATWGFDSGLVPPSGEWTMAAVVVKPTEADIYMGSISGGFVSVTNPVNHLPGNFTSGPFGIGVDINNTATRFFNGAIDEAAVYTNALSTGYLESLFFTGIGSNAAPFMVVDPPSITPTGTVYTTTSFSLAADVAGALPIIYQWRTNGIPIPGATSVTYTKANASTSDSANYDLVSSNAFGSVTSMVVSVTVNPAVPPTITLQPASRSVYAGGDATFSVAATGTTPFTYQWSFGGVNLPGQTNATLTITSVDGTKTGNYTVGVTNVAGGTLSATATLSLFSYAPGSYAEAVITNGPINYWHLGEPFASTIAQDAMGRLDGVYSNGVTLGVPGGLPFGTNTAVEFDGTSGRINLNASGIQPPWTAIFWAQRTDPSSSIQPSAALIDDRIAPVSCSLRLEQWDGTGLAGISQYGGFGDLTYSYAPPATGWIQIAFVGRTNGTDLYINGALTDSLTNTMPLPRRNIGASTSTDFLKAQLQEVSLYNKVLSASTLATIYAAGEYGTTTPPQIIKQPVSVTSLAGSTAKFSISAGGSLPLSYQWMKGATPIAGATTSALSIPGAYFTDVGTYSVTITNGIGATNSASVTLTVMPEPSYANATNGLVLHLKFDGDYSDSSGRTNNAAAVNAPVFVSGKIGSQAIRVNTDSSAGTFNYVVVLDTNTSTPYPDLQFAATDSFTVSYWSRYTGLPNDLPIICNAINSTYQPGWVFSDDTGKLEWTLTSVAPDSGQVVADPVPGSPIIDDGNWHQVVGSFDRASGQANSYVDGNLVDSRYIGVIGNLDTGNGLFLGQDPTGAYGVTGTYDIDDLGIWRRALSGYEALSIYNAGQISKESFDVYGPVHVSINQVGGNVDVSWQAGTLLQSSTLNGTYTPVPGATAPFYRTTAAGTSKFFRVQQ